MDGWLNILSVISILGCGWLGIPLAERLIQMNHSVKGSTRSVSKRELLKQKGLLPFQVDLERPGDIQAFLSSEVLIVAIPSKDIGAFEHLLQQIERSSIRKVIFISSTSVYTLCNQVVHESDCLNEVSPLRLIEKKFLEVKSFDLSILRLAGLVGPGRHPGRFFAQGNLLRNPDACVNLIHLNDCLNVIVKVLKSQAWGEIFNVCSDDHPSKRAFYSRAARAYNGASIDCVETEVLKYKIISSEKIKKCLGIEFTESRLMQDSFFETC